MDMMDIDTDMDIFNGQNYKTLKNLIENCRTTEDQLNRFLETTSSTPNLFNTLINTRDNIDNTL